MPRPRLKRLFRISLRMVFVLTTILCVWLGYKVHEVKRQQEAVSWVRAHGGEAYYGIGHGIDFTRFETAVTELGGIDYVKSPFYVRLMDQPMSDLTPLSSLPNLITLDVYNERNCDLSPLYSLTTLKDVSLNEHTSEEEVARLKRALPDCEIHLHLVWIVEGSIE